MNLDRFSTGLPDKQEAAALYTCDGCGGDIYEGEMAYDYQGEIACSTECVLIITDTGAFLAT